MAEVSDDVEIKLTTEDRPDDILNDQVDKNLLEEDLGEDDDSFNLDIGELEDTFPSNDDDSPDEAEIDLGMEEIGDLVEDLKLEVEENGNESSIDIEGDMVFEEEEIQENDTDSVESLLDELGDDDNNDALDDGVSSKSGVTENQLEEIADNETKNKDLALEQSSPIEKSADDTEIISEEDIDNPQNSDILAEIEETEISDIIEKESSEEELSMDNLDDTEDADLSEIELDNIETEMSTEENSEVTITEEEKHDEVTVGETSEDINTDIGMDNEEVSDMEEEENDFDDKSGGEDSSLDSKEEGLIDFDSDDETSQSIELEDEIVDDKEEISEAATPDDKVEDVMTDFSTDEVEKVEIGSQEDEFEDDNQEKGRQMDIIASEDNDILSTNKEAVNNTDLDELTNVKKDTEINDSSKKVQKTAGILLVESEKRIDSESEDGQAKPLGSEMLLNFNHEVVVEIAKTKLTGEEITQITYGSIIELDKVAGEPVNLVLDGKVIAIGEIVKINNEKLGIRIVGVI